MSNETPERRGVNATRRPMALWDRVKILIFLVLAFVVLAWHQVADNPILPVGEGLREVITAHRWILILAVLEAARQIHFLVAERSASYHAFWQEQFGRTDSLTSRWSAWTRYRVARFAKFLFFAVVAILVASAVSGIPASMVLFELPARLFSVMPLLLQLAFALMFGILQFVGIFWFLSRGGIEVYFPEDVKTRFTDVWGQDAVLERIRENILYLENPESIEDRGGYVPGGILLWGPPGTGKTLMAEAVAGETGKPYVFVDPGAFIQMFMGVGILKVKSLFRKLRKLSTRYGGVIVFFDEADSLGNRGSLMPGGTFGRSPAQFAAPCCHGAAYLSEQANSLLIRDALVAPASGAEGVGPRRDNVVMGGLGGGGGMGVLQALLSELSGLTKPRGFLNRYVRRFFGMRPKLPPKYRLLVMMATNQPQALDEALLRPGRIDRIYRVGYPSKAGRIRTYEGYFAKVQHALTSADMERLALMTPYATGATIKDLVNEALIISLREGHDVITWSDVIKAKHSKDLGPPQDIEYVERERHATAIHEACHAVVAHHYRKALTIDLATIEPGQTYLGMVSSVPPEDLFTSWRSDYVADILVSLASLAGEKMFFDGDSSSGVSGDLRNATRVATMMEGYWGMGSTVASHEVVRDLGVGGSGPAGREHNRDMLSGALGSRIERMLAHLIEEAERILVANRHQVLAVAHALETHKTITGDDVAAIIEGRMGTIVDGRRYQHPDFAEMAERYHAEALEAHRNHAAVAVALPRFDDTAVGQPAPVFGERPTEDPR